MDKCRNQKYAPHSLLHRYLVFSHYCYAVSVIEHIRQTQLLHLISGYCTCIVLCVKCTWLSTVCVLKMLTIWGGYRVCVSQGFCSCCLIELLHCTFFLIKIIKNKCIK